MKKIERERSEYQTPAIIYEGKITTRAGTPSSIPSGQGVDPAELFGSG